MVIAHLYKDLLNLYGNDGNIKILKFKLEQMGIDVVVEEPSLGDKMDFYKYDMVFIGSGTEKNQLLAINDIKEYKNEITAAIDAGKIFLIVGNSIDMFGNGLTGGAEDVSALGIIPFDSVWTKRIQRDVRRESKYIKSELLGFENHNYVMRDSNSHEELEEIIKNNFYGAYTEGPILVRNPEFCKKIIQLLTNKNIDSVDMSIEELAYDNFIKIFNGEVK